MAPSMTASSRILRLNARAYALAKEAQKDTLQAINCLQVYWNDRPIEQAQALARQRALLKTIEDILASYPLRRSQRDRRPSKRAQQVINEDVQDELNFEQYFFMGNFLPTLRRTYVAGQ